MVIAVAAVPLVLAIVLVAIIAASLRRPSAQATGQAAGSGADGKEALDPATTLPGNLPPGFTRTSQDGTRMSLRQFRGKAVVLAFADARCTPAPADHLQHGPRLSPGSARRRPGHPVVGVDANPDATRVAAVRAYSARIR